MEIVSLNDKNIRGYIADNTIYINVSSIRFSSYIPEDYFIKYICSELEKIMFHELGHKYGDNSNVCKHEEKWTLDDEFLERLGYGIIKCPWCRFTNFCLGDCSHNIGSYSKVTEEELHRRRGIRRNENLIWFKEFFKKERLKMEKHK